MCPKVKQREDDTRSAKMMLKFRDEKIHRMDALVNNKLPAESYLLQENKTLSQEVELLRARIDKNPEVTRFALENIRLSSQLKKYAVCTYNYITLEAHDSTLHADTEMLHWSKYFDVFIGPSTSSTKGRGSFY